MLMLFCNISNRSLPIVGPFLEVARAAVDEEMLMFDARAEKGMSVFNRENSIVSKGLVINFHSWIFYTKLGDKNALVGNF